MTRKRLICGLVLMGVLAVSAAAIAGGGGPRIDTVEASIVYTSAEIKQRACEGKDGEVYTEQRVRAFGEAEGDPRLTGEVVVTLKLLNEDSTGESYQQGRLVIRDPDSGRRNAVARFTDAGVAEIFQGVLVGELKRGSRALIANWRTTFHPNGAISAQIGGEAGDGRLPAIVAQGRCKGPFEESFIELPPVQDELSTTSRTAGKRVGWLDR
jgi:hypothetical protein